MTEQGIATIFRVCIIVLAVLQEGPHPVAQEPAEPDLSGHYIRGDFAGLGEADQVIGTEMLTVEGRRRWNEYDFRTDDPGYDCVPASWTRVWSNPNVVVAVSQAPDHVRLRYEFMDLDRVVPLVKNSEAKAPGSIDGIPTLGSYVGWYDGDTLVIDTNAYERGYVSTIADWAGLPQSRRMRTIERISRSEDGLAIEITHVDPVIFRQPLVVELSYAATNFELLEYGCVPEEARIVSPD